MIFEVRNASFGYKKQKNILNNIGFNVEQGEILSILGSNGVGKTTLLKCTRGFNRWKSGATYIDDKKWQDWKIKDIWKRIGYVPQAKKSSFSYTTEEMVLLGRNAHLGLLSQPGKEDKKKAEECLEMIGVEHLRGKLCNEISGGELQMVLVARALATDPELLILDEPESNLDFKNQIIVLDTIKSLCRDRHISSIFNTHYPEHAISVSDKALILYRDGTSSFGDAKSTIIEQKLRRAFDVDVRIRSLDIEGTEYTSVLPIGVINKDSDERSASKAEALGACGS